MLIDSDGPNEACAIHSAQSGDPMARWQQRSGDSEAMKQSTPSRLSIGWRSRPQGTVEYPSAASDFARTGATVPFIPVVTLSGEDSPPELWGALFHVDALKAYNRALAATAAEEHS